MKKFTSLLLITCAIALSLCGCKSNKEIDETTSVSETTTVATSEFNSSEVTTTEFAQSDEATIEGSKSIDGFTDTMETDIRDFNNPFPANAVFLRDIYDEIPSTEDGSYLELQNQLPKRITDTIEKYGTCTLYASSNYYVEYGITFYSTSYVLKDDPIYCAKPSYDSDLISYKNISNAVLYFDKATGMFLLQGIDSSRELIQYDFEGYISTYIGSPETIYNNIDIMDSNGKKVLNIIRNGYTDGTFVYDEEGKEIAIYQLGKKLDSFAIDLSNMDFTNEWIPLKNYPFLDNESNLMIWLYHWLDSDIRIEKISENVKQEISRFREISDIGSGPTYTLYEKNDNSFFIVEYTDGLWEPSVYSCHPISSIDDSLYLHFSVDEFGRCYLHKDLFMDDDLHLVAPRKYICYIPEKYRNTKLLHLQFSYSELEEKLEEVLEYSKSKKNIG